MIDVRYVRRMARYNQWQNQNLYSVADRLSDAARRQERGAFFGSIHKTFNHLMWADQIWISRFTGGPRPAGGIPESLTLYPDWDDLKPNRARFDTEIIRWADALAPTWLAGELTYHSFSTKRDIQGLRWVFVTHFFNHQTHHRGQVHCMLTQAGGAPDDTDFQLMPE